MQKSRRRSQRFFRSIACAGFEARGGRGGREERERESPWARPPLAAGSRELRENHREKNIRELGHLVFREQQKGMGNYPNGAEWSFAGRPFQQGLAHQRTRKAIRHPVVSLAKRRPLAPILPASDCGPASFAAGWPVSCGHLGCAALMRELRNRRVRHQR